MEKKIEHPDEEKRAERIYNCIILGLMIAGGVLLFVHWGYSLCVAGFVLWSVYFYEKGRLEWVCDEYEQNGYPSQGLHRMFESWRNWGIWVVLAAAVFMVMKIRS